MLSRLLRLLTQLALGLAVIGCLITVMPVPVLAAQQAVTTILLLRHADRAGEYISFDGLSRARELVQTVKKEKGDIKAVFHTKLFRT